RQYTCINCWNDDAGRCRTCAPIPGTDDLAARLAASAVAAEPGMQTTLADEDLAAPLGLDAWPTSDLTTDFGGSNGDSIESWPTAEAFPEESEPVAAEVEVEAEPEPVAAEAFPEESEPVAAEVEVEVEPEPVAAEVEVEVEPEPVAAEVEVETEPEPVAAEVELEVEPLVTEADVESMQPALRIVAWDEDIAYELLEPEPVAAEVQVEPEPMRPAARITSISDTLVRFPTRPTQAAPPTQDERAAAIADSPEQAARRAQLDSLGLGDPGQDPIAHDRSPALPYRSRGAAITQSELARQAALRGSFWEASAREVAGAAAHVGIGNCGQCGLSLSANARFCRRCGTRQAQSA
nr:hypothetical protein [Chloroflexota bacterium]